MGADNLIQIGSHDKFTWRMVVTSIANMVFILGQFRDDGNDDCWLNAGEVLAQWSLVGLLDLDDFGQTTLSGVCVYVGALGQVTHIWTKWSYQNNGSINQRQLEAFDDTDQT